MVSVRTRMEDTRTSSKRTDDVGTPMTEKKVLAEALMELPPFSPMTVRLSM